MSKLAPHVAWGRENWIRGNEMKTDQVLNDFDTTFTSSICKAKEG